MNDLASTTRLFAERRRKDVTTSQTGSGAPSKASTGVGAKATSEHPPQADRRAPRTESLVHLLHAPVH